MGLKIPPREPALTRPQILRGPFARLKGWVSCWAHGDLAVSSVLRRVPPKWRNGKWGSWWALGCPREEGWPPHFPRSVWAATKELLRINKYGIEKIRKELASEECEYLENAGV